MSREIKFRVWKSSEKQWVENYPLWMFAQETLSFNEVFTDENKNFGDNFYVFQQFTGLLDKNGKEIFEGDILKVKNFNGWFDDIGFYHNIEVKWEEKKFGETVGIGFHYLPDDREVVGNIFENPELLKS